MPDDRGARNGAVPFRDAPDDESPVAEISIDAKIRSSTSFDGDCWRVFVRLPGGTLAWPVINAEGESAVRAKIQEIWPGAGVESLQPLHKSRIHDHQKRQLKWSDLNRMMGR